MCNDVCVIFKVLCVPVEHVWSCMWVGGEFQAHLSPRLDTFPS